MRLRAVNAVLSTYAVLMPFVVLLFDKKYNYDHTGGELVTVFACLSILLSCIFLLDGLIRLVRRMGDN